MAAALAPLTPVVAPHFRKGEVDMALLKHQGMALAVGLAVSALAPLLCLFVCVCVEFWGECLRAIVTS